MKSLPRRPARRSLLCPRETTSASQPPTCFARVTPRTRLIAVANPNNPTGAVAEPADLLEIARRAPHAAILVDEAYFEFCGQTVLPQFRSLPNLFVARTFSKAYGMAGFRIGTLVGDAAHMTMVRRVSSPYNVNGVALACLPTALADDNYIQQYVEQVREGRAQLQEEFRNCGIPFWPSEANFVLARFGALKSAFIQGMRARGILVRDRFTRLRLRRLRAHHDRHYRTHPPPAGGARGRS